MLKYGVRLQAVHQKTGMTPYEVWKKTGVAQNTVRRFAENERVVLTRLDPSVLMLCRFYDVDWKTVVDVVEVGEDPEIKPPLPSAA